MKEKYIEGKNYEEYFSEREKEENILNTLFKKELPMSRKDLISHLAETAIELFELKDKNGKETI